MPISSATDSLTTLFILWLLLLPLRVTALFKKSDCLCEREEA